LLKQTSTGDDQQARDRIKHDLHTSFLVEAGAGSGKTTSLVDRMVNLIRTGTAKVEHIAAITFTNKAAAELLDRYRARLEQEWKSCTDPVERERFEFALRELGRCFIGTIHSFCGTLLRERPIEAGVDPAFREMDDLEANQFRDQCWDEYLMSLLETGKEDPLEGLGKLGVHVEDLRGVYHRVGQYEDVYIEIQEVSKPNFFRITESLFPLLEEATAYIPTSEPIEGYDTLQKLIRQANRMKRMLDMSQELNVLKLAKLFDRKLQVTQKRWTHPAKAKQLRDVFHQWQIDCLFPFLEHWREYVHPHVIRFVQPVIAYCREKRMEAGRLDFQDLLMVTAKLLREHREVRCYFSGRFRRLFVDEFQDTDPIQAEMMMLLTGAIEEESDWRKQLPKPGSLFVVGDPKQSIYRFRRADISTYNFIKVRMREAGDVLQLNKNFRSVHAIGDYVNYTFESLFALPGQSTMVQADFVRMETQCPNPKDRIAMSGVFTLTYSKVDHDRKDIIAEMDAERIARWIAWACNGNLTIQERTDGDRYRTRPAVPSDFMILLKRREFIGSYAEKLEQYGIPSDTSGSLVVYEEVRALYLLALALNDASDRISLLAVLRGMLFGVSDNALYQYRKEVGSISYYHTLDESEMAELSGASLSVHSALNKLYTYAGWVKRESALTAFTRIVHDLGLLPYAAVRATGATRAGTLVRLLQLIQSDEKAPTCWQELTLFMERVIGTEALEATSLFAGSGQAVRIMNLHKAKGLEAPVVFLACPCGDKDHDAEEHVDREADPARGYFTISRQRDSYNTEVIAQPVGWLELSEKEREFMRAEQDRLLYVATTRPKQLLIVSRYPREAIDPWSKLGVTLEKQLELDDVLIEPVIPESLGEAPPLDEEAARLQVWLDQAAVPTFERTNVTKESKAVAETDLHRSGGGGGMAFGSVVHRCLELLGCGAPEESLESIISCAAADYELDSKWLPEVKDAISKVLQHELWIRGKAALQSLHEFSFTLTKRKEDCPVQVIKGVIDYVFEEPDGWVIVDYKTDTFEPEHMDEFVSFYRPQVMAYVQEWESTFGYKVKEAGLYFIKWDQYIRVV
jgi:ATP-dependent helicase/nuclease subunit A